VVAAVLLVLLAGTAVAQESARTITVTGEGEQRIAADQAVLSVGIMVRGETLAEAKTSHDERARAVLVLLESQRIESPDVQTGRLSIQPLYRRVQGRQVEDGYQVAQWLTVKVRDLGRWEELLTALLEAGITNLSNAAFQSSRVDELRIEARRLALLDARRKAAEMAGVLGETLGPVLRIDERGGSGGDVPAYLRAGVAAEAMSQSGPIAAPGEIVVRASVQVTFRLRDSGAPVVRR
jgi:uncharacterized protein YggE